MNFVTRTFEGLPALRYAESNGGGPTLLLLHGVTRFWRDWEPLFPRLAREWHVLALDHRGHGGSGRADRYRVSDYVDDAVRFVRGQIRSDLVILGHSLGAMVAVAIAAELPQAVSAVVLEDPPFQTMGDRIHGTAWQAQFTGMRAAARQGGTVEELTDALAAIQLPAPGGGFKRLGDVRDRTSLRWSAECLAQLDPEVLTPVIEGRWLEGYDMADSFARVRCPVLLLQADPSAGGALTDEDAGFLLRSIPGSRLERFSRGGHLLHWLQPSRVAELVNDFAAPVSRGGHAVNTVQST